MASKLAAVIRRIYFTYFSTKNYCCCYTDIFLFLFVFVTGYLGKSISNRCIFYKMKQKNNIIDKCTFFKKVSFKEDMYRVHLFLPICFLSWHLHFHPRVYLLCATLNIGLLLAGYGSGVSVFFGTNPKFCKKDIVSSLLLQI